VRAQQLPSGGCDVLVILGSGTTGLEVATVADGRTTIHRLDASEALATKLAAALARFAPFAALGSRAWPPNDGETGPPSLMQRPFQNLVHHLAAGSAVVIVHTPDCERQLQMSRALLEAKCDILLTHDVVQAATDTSPAHADECCDNCTSQACRRMEPGREADALTNGAPHSKE
jgi:hypothetical protein